jgi:peptidoglycan/LPS O-acetylase OafA/YrhL
MTTTSAQHTTGSSQTRKTQFRPEVQGLRALAVGLVLLYHLWPERLSGGFVGVDVFFVISGYLITGHLYRELSTTGSIQLTKFWARRIMRLLPLAFTVLVFSFLCLILLLPESTWEMNLRQITASLFYVENWVLAADSVDYMAAENDPSLVQHYWSLSIEEQFYFVLPLILIGAFLLARRVGKQTAKSSTRLRLVIATLSVVGILSFIFSVLYTNYDPAQAYFVTPTRLWEFTVGGLVALTMRESTRHKAYANLVGWVGVGMILIAGFTFSEGTAFPGYTALLPVVGTAFFLRHGTGTPFGGVHWLAARRPAVRMGDWSYAIYLWHWPLIIVASYLLEEVRWPQKIAIIILTFILAALSQRYIEDPLRRAQFFKLPRRAFVAMVTSLVVITISFTVVPQYLETDSPDTVAMADCTGADALLAECADQGLDGEPLIGAALVSKEKSEPPYPECFIPGGKTDFDRSDCSLGVAPEDAELTIAMFGSSHARMWLPMLDNVGKEHNWNIQGYTKSGCAPVPLALTSPKDNGADREENEACDHFVTHTAEFLALNPEIDVIATASVGSGHDYYMTNGTLATDRQKIEAIDNMWQRWIDAGKTVITFAEVPYFSDVDAPLCVEKYAHEIATKCTVSYEEAISDRGVFQRRTAAEGKADVRLYDPAEGMCEEGKCYSMVGKLITRYDHSHLSEHFVRSYSTDFANFMYKEVLEQTSQ